MILMSGTISPQLFLMIYPMWVTADLLTLFCTIGVLTTALPREPPSRSIYTVPIAILYFKDWAIFSQGKDVPEAGRLIRKPLLMLLLVSVMLRATLRGSLEHGRWTSRSDVIFRYMNG